ncbi:unnamed protein product [Thlaspi arvense]|uniref:F-box domain-containing protein n=1 Tax=Thlaspi arvense TaxID=13288 RepID=A0AAU9SVM2_THLAR|nr:unnamed protein product [Thlaspi arvense]
MKIVRRHTVDNRIGYETLNAILEKIGNAEEMNEIAYKGFYLPMEILLDILSRLSLKDNVRASSVCKAWHEAAVSVRRNSPWLVYFNISRTGHGVSFGFYDPADKIKTKSMKLPNQPFHASLCYSKDGWLLLLVDYHGSNNRLIFFNPFTRVHMMLPSLITIETFGADFAFSCAPTNESCVVCCISNRTPDSFLIHTWCFGAAEWVTEEFHKPSASRYRGRNNIIFSDGCFWFPDEDGLGVFHTVTRTWDTLYVPLRKLIPFLMFITEYKGNIFLVAVVSNRSQKGVVLFGLNQFGLVWEKKETFDGLSIFISDESSIITNGLTGDMSDIVYVWDSHLIPFCLSKFSLSTGSLCTVLDGHRMSTGTSANDSEEMHFGAWIEPPQDINIYDFPIIEP